MNESIIINRDVKCSFSAHASLCAVGVMIQKLKLFAPIVAKVKIAQKIVKYSPVEKLLDGYIAILAGVHGIVEINKRLRADPGLQLAFGRTGCAEQSVVQDTLDACSAENVTQMHQAMDTIFRQNSRSYRHDYHQEWQVLDGDTTGRPCGKKAAFASWTGSLFAGSGRKTQCAHPEQGLVCRIGSSRSRCLGNPVAQAQWCNIAMPIAAPDAPKRRCLAEHPFPLNEPVVPLQSQFARKQTGLTWWHSLLAGIFKRPALTPSTMS